MLPHRLFLNLLFMNVFAILESKEFICAGNYSTTCKNECIGLYNLFEKENPRIMWHNHYLEVVRAFKMHRIRRSIEIGVLRGDLSKALLVGIPHLEHIAIDPFIGGYDEKDSMSIRLKQTNASLDWANALLYTMSEFGCRFKLLHGFSADMVRHFSVGTIDCVYIDGDHTYSGVAADIKMWGPIVRPGGMIVFDDYGDGPAASFPGVVQAVDEFVAANKLQLMKLARGVKRSRVMVMKPHYPLKYDDFGARTDNASRTSTVRH